VVIRVLTGPRGWAGPAPGVLALQVSTCVPGLPCSKILRFRKGLGYRTAPPAEHSNAAGGVSLNPQNRAVWRGVPAVLRRRRVGVAYQIFPGMGVHLQVGGGGGGGGGVAVVPYIITTPIVIFERNMVNSGI
jgi:hypothetical protein